MTKTEWERLYAAIRDVARHDIVRHVNAAGCMVTLIYAGAGYLGAKANGKWVYAESPAALALRIGSILNIAV